MVGKERGASAPRFLFRPDFLEIVELWNTRTIEYTGNGGLANFNRACTARGANISLI